MSKYRTFVEVQDYPVALAVKSVILAHLNPCTNILQIMENYRDNFKIVSIIVGDLSVSQARKYAKVMQPLLADPATVFVVSSDFCHWGSRFRYAT